MPNRTASVTRALLGSLLVGSCVLLAPGVASAGDKALAETLFQEGRKLLDAGQYDQACAKFDASQRQDPSPGTLINLGKCNESRGKTATAWANYKEAEALARNMSRAEQEQIANERAAALEGKLSKLTISPPAVAIEGLTVKRSGVALSTDALGVASPIDPGEYEIEASAPGYDAWRGKVTVGKQADNANITIPSLQKASAPPAPAPGAAPPAPTDKPAPSGVPGEKAQGKSSTATIGWVLTGVGAVALLAGGYFGYAASSQASDAEDDPSLCPNKQCTAAGRDEIDSAKGKALISTIGVGAGIAALGAGIVLIVTSPSPKEQARASRPIAQRKAYTRVAPYADGRNAGLFVTGAF